jgi:hypothetical protein
MDVCVVFVVRTVAWNVKWHEGRTDLNSTKMDQGEKPRTGKKNRLGHVCLLWVLCVVCATSRGVLPTVVCLKCVIVKPWKKKWGSLGPQGAVEPLKKKKRKKATHILFLFTSI